LEKRISTAGTSRSPEWPLAQEASFVAAGARVWTLTRTTYCFLTILALGVVLRVYQINYEFHYDEVFSVEAASGNFSHIIETTFLDRTHPPLYPVLLHGWIKLWGHSEVSVRLLSILASVGFLIIVYRLASRWMPEGSALFVVLVCAISPFFVYYGRWARPYSLAAFLSVLSVYLLLKSQEDPKPLWPILYGLSCALLVYTQYLAAFVLLPQFAFLGFSALRDKRSRTLLFAGLIGASSIVFWLAFLGENLRPEALNAKIDWLPVPSLYGLLRVYTVLFGDFKLSLIITFYLLLMAAVAAPIFLRYKTLDRKTLFLVASIALLGPILAFVVSRYGPVSIWLARQLIGPAVFFICLLGIALSLHRRAVAMILGGIIVAWCGLGLPFSFPDHPAWRTIVNLVDQRCPGCDVMVEGELTLRPIRFYAGRNVLDADQYANGFNSHNRVAFLCRPVRCETLKSLATGYNVKHIERIQWKGTESVYDTIDVYSLSPHKVIEHNRKTPTI
jgi:4-amino-4-deoxy-L-arabinose transferase-like glycosyltransferase